MTDGAGQFAVNAVPDGTFLFMLSAPGYLTHYSHITTSGSRAGLILDLISASPPFSLAFYRQFARGARDSKVLWQLNPWTIAPSIYVRLVTDDTGEQVAPDVIEGIRRIATNSIPELSGGRLTLATFESGVEARPIRQGWVNVIFVRDTSLIGDGGVTGAAGRSSIGGNAGAILVEYRPEPCVGCLPACASETEWSFDHEIVHAMGFYHTDDGYDFHSGTGCPGSGRPSQVQYHAAIMYSRPVGNGDPDSDPGGFTYSLSSAMPRFVTCRVINATLAR